VTRSRWFAIALAALIGLTLLVAQDPGVRTAYIWVRDAQGNHFVPLTGGITVAPDGKSAAIVAGKTYTFGIGLVAVDPGTGTVQVSVDTSQILYRVTPPTGPGPCPGGTGAISGSVDGYQYMCIPDGTGNGFRWARAPVETSW
jgi:hypothetical protein